MDGDGDTVSHWYTQEQLVRERHADLAREAAHHSPSRHGRDPGSDRDLVAMARTWLVAIGARLTARLGGLGRGAADRQPGAACALPGVRPMAMVAMREVADAGAPGAPPAA